MQDEYTTEADVPSASENGEGGSTTAQLQQELQAATARAEENYNKFLLATADFENYKKRMERQFREIADAKRRELLRSFLPVLDNLERALSYEGASGDALRNGVQQTLKGFENVLTMEGVRPVSVKGQKFDPAIAEAIGTQSAPGVEEDTVLEEAQKAYKIGEELLRPAKVIVAKNAAE
ncbi:MAG TPA: nucleotide exchange factor GrpE [Candidatus Baltobacteraceae bacterium]|jgi:molecular chaperone GrpE|nr:nucleotide exchange factor GrpE [Candidatus Baltobacteraceae bacterium]